jgi:hypothetical protein
MRVYAYIHPELNILCVALDQSSVPLNVKYQVFEVEHPDDVILDDGVIRLKTDDDRKRELIPQAKVLLNTAYFDFISRFFRERGYNSIGDVVYYANTKSDDEAKALLDFYDKFENAFWNYYNNLSNLSVQELRSVIANPVSVLGELQKNV